MRRESLIAAAVLAAATGAAVWLALAALAPSGQASGVAAALPASGQAVQPAAAAGADDRKDLKRETATFAAGCFWGVEATFREVKGVVDAAVGYTGGTTENPTYEDVCTDRTGHAEAVQVRYDPSIVSYEDLLAVFWKAHDPTTVNRQGPDVGTQYRSAIFYHTPEQEKAARTSKEKIEKSCAHRRPIATEIVPAGKFWRAEEYHQRYLEKHGLAQCHIR